MDGLGVYKRVGGKLNDAFMKLQTFILNLFIVSIIYSCNNPSDNNELNSKAKSNRHDSIAIDLNKLVIDTTMYKSFNKNMF